MIIKKIVIFGATMTGLALAGSTWSHPPAGGPNGPEFPISIADAQARAAEVFAEVDADGNGTISSAEFEAADLPRGPHHHPEGRHGFRHDGEHAGKQRPADDATRSARRAEHEAEFFKALDTDGNGQLSASEFSRDHQRDVRQSLMKAHAFEHLDTDGNGELSKSEFPGRISRLTELDADDNGEVSRDELRDGMRARHRQAD